MQSNEPTQRLGVNAAVILEAGLFATLCVVGVYLWTAYWASVHHQHAFVYRISFVGVEPFASLKETQHVGKFTTIKQSMAQFRNGTWSSEYQSLIIGASPGEFVEWNIPAPKHSGDYRLTVFLTKAPDYGVVQFSIADQFSTPPIDLWSSNGVIPTGPIDLGVIKSGKPLTLRMVIQGRNRFNKAPHFQVGLDGFRLAAIEP